MEILKDIGNLVISPLEKDFLDKKTEYLITNYNVCNFILFKRNIKNPNQLKKLINDIKMLCKNQGLSTPLFAIDQEGGKVQRLGPPYWPNILSNKEVGDSNQPFNRLIEQVTNTINILKPLNINLNLAPVLDIASSNCNEVLLGRSYGPNEEKVSILGSMYIKIFNENRLCCCAKHFPGIGAIDKDPHKDIPIVKLNTKELKRHLLPFITAIKLNVSCIMTSHVIYPHLDKNIATYSYNISTTLLRDILGFKGVLITDDMEMKGTGEEDISTKSLKAFMAGHDLILLGNTPEKIEEILKCFSKKLEDLSFCKRVSSALSRIKTIKSKINSF